MYKDFSITSITILDNCAKNLIKNLNPGTYYFNRWEDDNNCFVKDFFGRNISIQAIVGKNGSGKSSLIDLVIRLINNFSYMIFNGKDNNKYSLPVCYVENVWATLNFMINNDRGQISCRGESLGYRFGGIGYYFGPLISEFNGYRNGNIIDDENVLDLTQNFFYTVVVNYSIHAFNEDSYSKDTIKRGKDTKELRPWIKSLFHKNDGYRTPIVLNPYKDEGILDMDRENHLNQSRLISILKFSEKNNLQFIDNYKLKEIDFRFDSSNLIDKFKFKDITVLGDIDEDEFINNKDVRYKKVMDSFILALQSKKSYSTLILNNYGFYYNKNIDDSFRLVGYLYLVYKVLNIAATYPTFNKYKEFGNMQFCFSNINPKLNNYNKKLVNLVNELKKNTSHITLKLRQTCLFLSNYKNKAFGLNVFSGSFNYEKYLAVLNNLKVDYQVLDDIMVALPPSFFKPNIYLDKYDINNRILNLKPIQLNDLSSGELQFIHTMSTVVYHTKNLLTITENNRVKYRCVNLLMDEIELCFHPDYQRLFIKRIINTLQRMGLTEECSFNILFSTHSPFILSDIIQSNVLYLNDGKDVSKSIKLKSFGANVNDLLKQSFFLDCGFLGEFAKDKILSLIEFLSNNQTQNEKWTIDTAERMINEIGDSLIKEQLYSLFLNKKYPCDDYSQREWLIRKLDQLNK